MESTRSTGRDRLNPQQLLELALQRLREGTLSREARPRLFAGQGRQARCSLCGEPISTEDIEYEVETASTVAGGQQLRFHRPCYYAWLQACSDPGADSG